MNGFVLLLAPAILEGEAGVAVGGGLVVAIDDGVDEEEVAELAPVPPLGLVGLLVALLITTKTVP